MSNSQPTIVIYGATGGLGRWLVWQILQDQNRSPKNYPFRFRLPVRDQSRAKALYESLKFKVQDCPEIELVDGDLTNLELIEKNLQDAVGVIVAVGIRHSADSAAAKKRGLSKKLEEEGIQNLVDAAKRSGSIQHIVFISRLLVLRPSHTDHVMLNYNYDDTMNNKRKAEYAVRSGGIPYTIIRPGNFDRVEAYPQKADHFQLNAEEQEVWNLALQGSSKGKEKEKERLDPPLTEIEKKLEEKFVIDQGDKINGQMHRRDVAFLALLALALPQHFQNITYDVVLRKKSPQNSTSSSKKLFDQLLKETEIMPQWEDDENVSNCRICNSVFWMLNNRHHCRKCGRIICGHCLGTEQPIPQFGLPHPVKHCDECSPESG